MRLPRRVPWASISELEQACSWIFAGEDDTITQMAALHRLAAWRAITSLPLALESTHNLLAVILQDRSEQSPSCFLALRQAYAAAIIRFVNGLVDPLQLGAYARSVASIAAQLGLPSWFVELRHAATHGDLPSLELLREAAKESMQWLLHNYFLPTLNPSSIPRSQELRLRPLSPLLKQYKALFKLRARDASLETQLRPQTRAVLRDIERWIAEAKAATSLSLIYSHFAEHEDNSEDSLEKERSALLQLCDGLLAEGGLVPLSKKKRVCPTESFRPPASQIALWEPLLLQLASHHKEFPIIFIKQITDRLSTAASPKDELGVPLNSCAPHPLEDAGWDMYLVRWVTWAVHTWSSPTECGSDLGRHAIRTLLTAFGPAVMTTGQSAASALLRSLIEHQHDLTHDVTNLLRDVDVVAGNWTDEDMGVMEKRLDAFISATAGNLPEDLISMASHSVALTSPDLPVEVSPGWHRLPISSYRASPIGIFVNHGPS